MSYFEERKDYGYMPMEIKIEIQKEHIKKGIQGECQKCAIALAVLDHFNKEEIRAWNTKVDCCSFDVLVGDFEYTYNPVNSDTMAQFVSDFDEDKTKVKPLILEFEIDVAHSSPFKRS